MKKITQRQREQQRLAAEYAELSERLEQCRTNYDHTTDDDAIDALIYEENSILARMAALTKQARAAGFSSEPF